MNTGILFPLSSFPSNHGVGDLGQTTYNIIDSLVSSGANYLQILPFHPSTQANSPYRAVSTYAGDEIYINLDFLVSNGLLESVPKFHQESKKVPYDEVRKFKREYLKKAYRNFKPDSNYHQFLKECSWVFDYAIFSTFAYINDTYDWASWPEEYKHYPQSHRVNLTKYTDQIGYYQFVQFIFYQQWFKLKAYANEKGIKIIGDMPFYVDHGSVEVWLDNKSFLLDEEGYPTSIAGVPPDYFSPTGQYWGNPLYDWDYMETHQFRFWIERIGWASKIFDITRIDHFRAFDSYWKIPATAETAIEGHWCYAPGYALFDSIYDSLGQIELVAEDLGYLRPEVIELKDHYHLKGMKVFQFMLDDGYDDLDNSYFYSGTHDNETILGWVKGLNEENYTKLLEIVGDSLPANRAVLKYCLHSTASDVIIPIWDLLEVDNDERFNIPGTVNDTNWAYRVSDIELVNKGLALFTELKNK